MFIIFFPENEYIVWLTRSCKMFIKICGLKKLSDIICAASAGADAVGFVAWPRSVRFIEPGSVKELLAGNINELLKVGVFVDPDAVTVHEYLDAGINVVQLHGDEPPEFARIFAGRAEIWRAIKPRSFRELELYREYPADKFLVDTFTKDLPGGSGKTGDWELARLAVEILPKPVILAGGLNAGNVINAVSAVKPFGVDVSGGVESSPGDKAPELIKEFILKVKENIS